MLRSLWKKLFGRSDEMPRELLQAIEEGRLDTFGRGEDGPAAPKSPEWVMQQALQGWAQGLRDARLLATHVRAASWLGDDYLERHALAQEVLGSPALSHITKWGWLVTWWPTVRPQADEGAQPAQAAEVAGEQPQG